MATAGLDAAPAGMPSISGSNGTRTNPTMGVQNAARSLELQQQYVTPSHQDAAYQPHDYMRSDTGARPSTLPHWYPDGTSQLPVSYVGPSAAKDSLARRQAILYASEFLVPATAPDEPLMALTNLTKRWFAHCGRKLRV